MRGEECCWRTRFRGDLFMLPPTFIILVGMKLA
jgi:hypothetical protein